MTIYLVMRVAVNRSTSDFCPPSPVQITELGSTIYMYVCMYVCICVLYMCVYIYIGISTIPNKIIIEQKYYPKIILESVCDSRLYVLISEDWPQIHLAIEFICLSSLAIYNIIRVHYYCNLHDYCMIGRIFLVIDI